MKYLTRIGDREYQVEFTAEGQVLVNGRPAAVDLQAVDAPFVYSLLLDNVSYEAYVEEQPEGYDVLLRGQEFPVAVREAWTHGLERDLRGWGPPTKEMAIRSPMPGLVQAILAHEGDQVAAGDLLLVLETMKMENELRSPRAGVVKAIHVQLGDAVAPDQDLVVIG